MFPLIHIIDHDDLPSRDRSLRPPSRLDVQRQHLEHAKMYHLNSMVVDHEMSNLNRQLARRLQILQATDGQTSLGHRIRQRVATFLIATGQRIEPAASMREPQFNA